LLEAVCVHISLSEDWCRFLITHCTYNYRNFALTHTLHTYDGTVVYICIVRYECSDVKKLSTLFSTRL